MGRWGLLDGLGFSLVNLTYISLTPQVTKKDLMDLYNSYVSRESPVTHYGMCVRTAVKKLEVLYIRYRPEKLFSKTRRFVVSAATAKEKAKRSSSTPKYRWALPEVQTSTPWEGWSPAVQQYQSPIKAGRKGVKPRTRLVVVLSGVHARRGLALYTAPHACIFFSHARQPISQKRRENKTAHLPRGGGGEEASTGQRDRSRETELDQQPVPSTPAQRREGHPAAQSQGDTLPSL